MVGRIGSDEMSQRRTTRTKRMASKYVGCQEGKTNVVVVVEDKVHAQCVQSYLSGQAVINISIIRRP